MQKPAAGGASDGDPVVSAGVPDQQDQQHVVGQDPTAVKPNQSALAAACSTHDGPCSHWGFR